MSKLLALLGITFILGTASGFAAGAGVQQARYQVAFEEVRGIAAEQAPRAGEIAAIQAWADDANAQPPLDVQLGTPAFYGAGRVPGSDDAQEFRFVYFTLPRSAADGTHDTVHELAWFLDGQLLRRPLKLGVTL